MRFDNMNMKINRKYGYGQYAPLGAFETDCELPVKINDKCWILKYDTIPNATKKIIERYNGIIWDKPPKFCITYDARWEIGSVYQYHQ